MPQVRKTGTACDRSLGDYVSTRGLDHMGWAWEFLRRNEAYQRDFRINRAGNPVPIKHTTGAVVLRLRRCFLEAEKWGLHCFADPQKSAHDAHVFWLADQVQNSVSCTLRVANDNESGALSLASFAGQRRVLVTPNDELIVIAGNQMYACMVVRNSTSHWKKPQFASSMATEKSFAKARSRLIRMRLRRNSRHPCRTMSNCTGRAIALHRRKKCSYNAE